MRAFVGAISGDRAAVLTSAREAVTSHLLAFAAEEARATGDSVTMRSFTEKAAASRGGLLDASRG
jgi:hypothetical protein